jgi:hypothetical protein
VIRGGSGPKLPCKRFASLKRAASQNRKLQAQLLPMLQRRSLKDVQQAASNSDAADGKIVANGLQRRQSPGRREGRRRGDGERDDGNRAAAEDLARRRSGQLPRRLDRAEDALAGTETDRTHPPVRLRCQGRRCDGRQLAGGLLAFVALRGA